MPDLRDLVQQALRQPTLADFAQAVAEASSYRFELRGGNPTLVDGSLLERRDLRLCRLGLRPAFWIRLVTGWTTDFEALADQQGIDLLAHLWRGLVGRRLTPPQRPEVRALAKQAGIVEAAKAMCAAVSATPDGTPDEVFACFRDRCAAIAAERRRQGLPAPVVKRPRRERRIDLKKTDWMLKALGIGIGRGSPKTWEEFLDTFPGRRLPDADGTKAPACTVTALRQSHP